MKRCLTHFVRLEIYPEDHFVKNQTCFKAEEYCHDLCVWKRYSLLINQNGLQKIIQIISFHHSWLHKWLPILLRVEARALSRTKQMPPYPALYYLSERFPLLFSLFTPPQPHWLPCCSSNKLGILLPQKFLLSAPIPWMLFLKIFLSSLFHCLQVFVQLSLS